MPCPLESPNFIIILNKSVVAAKLWRLFASILKGAIQMPTATATRERLTSAAVTLNRHSVDSLLTSSLLEYIIQGLASSGVVDNNRTLCCHS